MPTFDDNGDPIPPYIVQTMEGKMTVQADGFGQGQRFYKVVLGQDINDADEDLVRSLVENDADGPPATWSDLSWKSYDLDHKGAGVWEVVVHYVGHKPVYTFDCTGGTRHITQARKHIADYAPTGVTPPNFHGVIGVEGQTVQGCDITIPVWKWTELHRKKVHEVDAQYLRTVFQLTGTVNFAPWRIFQKGEALFLGITGGQHGQDEVEMTFHFAASFTQNDFIIGDGTFDDAGNFVGPGILIPQKEGWHYLWVRYGATPETFGVEKVLTKPPISAHVEQVYLYADFLGLEIDANPAWPDDDPDNDEAGTIVVPPLEVDEDDGLILIIDAGGG